MRVSFLLRLASGHWRSSMNEDALHHLAWIHVLVENLRETRDKPVHPDWDSRESYIATKLVNETSNFANLTSAEKRDVFIYLLGRIVEDDNGGSNE